MEFAIVRPMVVTSHENQRRVDSHLVRESFWCHKVLPRSSWYLSRIFSHKYWSLPKSPMLNCSRVEDPLIVRHSKRNMCSDWALDEPTAEESVSSFDDAGPVPCTLLDGGRL